MLAPPKIIQNEEQINKIFAGQQPWIPTNNMRVLQITLPFKGFNNKVPAFGDPSTFGIS